MPVRVDLPEGQWADLRTQGEMTNPQRALLRGATPAVAALGEKMKLLRLELGIPAPPAPADGSELVLTAEQIEATGPILARLTPDDMEVYAHMQCMSVVAYVAAWSLTTPDGAPRPLPTVENIDYLEGTWLDPLVAAAGRLGDAKPVDFTADGGVGPGSPTEPSQP